LEAAVFVAGAATVAHARWPAEFTAPFNYYSIDPAPIEVTLVNANDPDPANGRVLLIPRAAIVALAEYDASRVPRLPDKLRTGDIEIVVTYPDGKPLSIRAAEIAAASPSRTRVDWRALRQEEYLVHLHPAGAGNQWEERTRQDLSRFKIIDQYDGLPHAPADNYFGNAGVDQFSRIHCYPEANPNYFCTMQMRIGFGIIAIASFPDFRFQGGRSFANERARRLREIVCRYVKEPC